MRRLGLVLLASIALAGTAAAADMPAKIYTKAPIIDPPYNWTGLYIGLNAGYSWGKQDNSLQTLAGVVVLSNSNSNNINGAIGGGQIGYNWQYNQIVLGVEADIQASGQKGDGTYFIPAVIGAAAVPASNFNYTDKLDWFGTVRGRLGLVAGRWLPYVTGGWAFGHGKVSGSSTGNIVSAWSGSKSYSGWTVGAGLEYAFRNNWSVKAEYLYIDFGDGPTVPVGAALLNVSGKLTDNIVRLGVNYKF